VPLLPEPATRATWSVFVKVYQILFILWLIVFAGWLWGQFTRSNKKMYEELAEKKRLKALQSSSSGH
jgi:flagellar biogenesis protein FliO